MASARVRSRDVTRHQVTRTPLFIYCSLMVHARLSIASLSHFVVNDYKVIMMAKFATLATLIISDLWFSLKFGTVYSSFNCQQQQPPIFMLVSKYTDTALAGAGARCWAKLALRTLWPVRSVVKSILNKTASVLHNVWVIISFPRNAVTCNDCGWHDWGGDHFISLAKDLKVVDCNFTFNGLSATDKISFPNEWLRWESPDTTPV